MFFSKKAFLNKDKTRGTWISLPNLETADILSQFDFDWFAIDLEHTPTSVESASKIIHHFYAKKTPVFVRVSHVDETMIKKVMDAGASGIIVPQVNTLEDVEKTIDYLYYSPLGKRGVGLHKAQRYGLDFFSYREWSLKNQLFIAQIENVMALEHLDKIVSNSHVDGIIIGPYDLSASMGIPGDFDSPVMQEAVDKIKKTTLKYGKKLGFHVINPDAADVTEKERQGFNFIAFSIDFLFMSKKIEEEYKKLK
tara:strand:- start:14934 stop:15689 length:756 start_codon:yes stop_codon:yes gene_type:complete